jgi:hypothetical protein
VAFDRRPAYPSWDGASPAVSRGVRRSQSMLVAMIRWSARRLILTLAVVTALFDLAVLLPGNPYSSRDGFIGAVLVQALVLWGLWRGSVVAWVVATAFAVLTALTIPLMQPPPDAGVFILIFSVVQAVILCTREVRAFVDRGGEPKYRRLPNRRWS